MEHSSLVKEQFNRQADAYASNEVVRDERTVKFLVRLANAGRNDRVLDVACGPAFVTLALAERGAHVVGVDITDNFIAMARAEASRRNLSNVRFVPGDVEQLPFPDESFDLALCKFAFHHFPRPERVLAEMKRVTTSSGRIILLDMITSEDPLKAARHNEIEKLCDPSHAEALPKSRFEEIFQELGLAPAFQIDGEAEEVLDDWMRHAGPSSEATERITQLLKASLDEDRTGLKVRTEDGKLYLTHTGTTYVLTRKS